MDKTKVVEKIKKLLALAADAGASRGESETAARQAGVLMAKYEIDEANLVAGPVLKCGFAYARHMNLGVVKAPMYAQFIAVGVSDFIGCVTIIVNRIEGTKQSQLFKIGGTVSDVKFAVWLTETLCAQALREWAAYKGEATKVAWLNGWGSAVQTRLRDMAEAKQAGVEEVKASDSTSLMVLDKKVALVREKFGEVEYKKNENVKLNLDGWTAGQKTVIPTGALETKKQEALQ